MNRSLTQALAYLAIPAALLVTPLANAAPAPGDVSVDGGPPRIAQGPHAEKGGGPDRESRHLQVMQRLGLTPEQSEKMRTVMQQGKSQSRELHQQLQSKRQAFMRYIQTADAQEAQAQRLHNEMNELQHRLGELRVKTWFQMRQLLTPEQRQKLEQLRQNRSPERRPGAAGMPHHHRQQNQASPGGDF